MREAIELQERPRAEFSSLLVEAASFEREAERDLTAAERHLAVAVRLSPRDEAIAARYREVALELADERRRARSSQKS